MPPLGLFVTYYRAVPLSGAVRRYIIHHTQIRKHRLMMDRNIVSGGSQLGISPASFSPASADRTSAWLSRPGKGGAAAAAAAEGEGRDGIVQ